jgi:hypothetical protein
MDGEEGFVEGAELGDQGLAPHMAAVLPHGFLHERVDLGAELPHAQVVLLVNHLIMP